jgi:hypothetical protein
MYIPEPIFFPLLIAVVLGLFAMFRYFVLKMLRDNDETQTKLSDSIDKLNSTLLEFKDDINKRLVKLETEHHMMTSKHDFKIQG